ncbi:MAG: hypothetical protein ACOYB7_12555 [Mycobacterium sp.]
MTLHLLRRGAVALAGATIVGAALACAASAPADPADPVVPTYPVVPPPAPQAPGPMTPNQPAVPAADPATVPPPADLFTPHVPEIQNPTYGSGKNGGGVLGTLKDLWDQVKNPTLDGSSDEGRPAPPPGAGPAPALPPGYVSINAPGSETASTVPAGGPATGRPALPPGYYSTSGPPPPGYQFGAPAAAPVTTPVTIVPTAPPAS